MCIRDRPTAVAGIALTHLTTTNGLLGAFFGKVGIRIAYTRLGIIFALIFVVIPFVVRAVQPVLEKVDSQYEEAANMPVSYTHLDVYKRQGSGKCYKALQEGGSA